MGFGDSIKEAGQNVKEFWGKEGALKNAAKTLSDAAGDMFDTAKDLYKEAKAPTTAELEKKAAADAKKQAEEAKKQAEEAATRDRANEFKGGTQRVHDKQPTAKDVADQMSKDGF